MLVGMQVDLTQFCSSLASPADPDDRECYQLQDEAEHFLCGFDWCGCIQQKFVGGCVPGIIGVFLFEIVPTQEIVDHWLWVVVGDLPPAYIVTDEASSPKQALEHYIEEMERWVNAVKSGEPVEELIPVNVPPTADWAAALGTRLAFLRQNLLPDS